MIMVVLGCNTVSSLHGHQMYCMLSHKLAAAVAEAGYGLR